MLKHPSQCKKRGCKLFGRHGGWCQRHARSWKLTESQRDEIVERRRAGETLKAIAPDYGISLGWITRLMKRAGVPPRFLPRSK